MIYFKASKRDRNLVKKIADRAVQGFMVSDRKDLEMDLIATHSNGCPLDFEKLLAFDDFNFTHDIRGIQTHLDRRITGNFQNCFFPRCSRPARRKKREAA